MQLQSCWKAKKSLQLERQWNGFSQKFSLWMEDINGNIQDLVLTEALINMVYEVDTSKRDNNY